MYGKSKDVDNAQQLFDKMPTRTIHSWVGIITLCTKSELYRQALLLFIELVNEEIGLEFFVFPVVLKACGGVKDLYLGTEVHGLALKSRFVSNIYVGNALIHMYRKCGVMDEAVKILNGMPERDCVSWNSVISGCASNAMVF